MTAGTHGAAAVLSVPPAGAVAKATAKRPPIVENARLTGRVLVALTTCHQP